MYLLACKAVFYIKVVGYKPDTKTLQLFYSSNTPCKICKLTKMFRPGCENK